MLLFPALGPLRDARITRRFETVPRLLIFAKEKSVHRTRDRIFAKATRKFDHDDRHFDERGDERRREDRAETDAEGSPCSAVRNFCASAVNPAG